MKHELPSTPSSGRRRPRPAKTRQTSLVLLVDDDPDLREMIKLALQAAQLTVLEAATSKAALSCARRRRLALVISDIARPGMNGLRFLKLFKKAYPQVPVIIASGDPKRSTETKAAQLGAFAFLPKPFALDSLLKLVNQALATRRTGRP